MSMTNLSFTMLGGTVMCAARLTGLNDILYLIIIAI